MQNKYLYALISVFTVVFGVSSQLQSTAHKIVGPMPQTKSPNQHLNRSNGTPRDCGGDTVVFPLYGTTAYYTVSIKKGQFLGQFYGAPQDIKIKGFQFYGFAISTTKNLKINAICRLYKAGPDSLPTGLPLAADTIELDTVKGSSIPLNRIYRSAEFSSPVTVNYPYIITVESDSTSESLAVITNSWLLKEGDGKNFGCGSVSGKWYRCLNLNISGNVFDAHMQFYPYVEYKLATDFKMSTECYTGDTVRFTNLKKDNVSGTEFYNYYAYYGLEQYNHRWNYDNTFDRYGVDMKVKYNSKANYDVRLITSFWPYNFNYQCIDTMTKQIYFMPDKPSIKSQSRSCKGDDVTINLNGNGYISWYHKMTDASPFFIGSSYTITNHQKADTFYVKGINDKCISNFLTVVVPINDYPNDPIVKNDSVCLGASANLQASTNIGKIDWFSKSSGGTPVFTGTALNTGKLFLDSVLYVEANNNGCINKGGRIKVMAAVSNNFAPSKPDVMDTFTCKNPTATFTMNANYSGTDTLRWFTTASGGKPAGYGNTYSMSPKTRGDFTYYVEAWNGICGSGRQPLVVHVYDYSILFGKQDKTICLGDTAKISLGVSYGDIFWYLNKSNTTPDYTGKNQQFGDLTKTTTFYLKTTEKGCTSPNFDSVRVTVNAPPVPSQAIAPAVCSKGLGVMQVDIPAGKVDWYEDMSSTTPVFTGSPFNLGVVLGNQTYYYQTSNLGCTSVRKPLILTIKPRPIAGFTWTLAWQNKVTCVPINSTNTTFVWYWGDGGTSTTSAAQHVYTNSGMYTIRQVATSTANGCKDTADIQVNVSHLSTVTLQNNKLSIYPNPIKAGNFIHVKQLNNTEAAYQILDITGKRITAGNCLNATIQTPQSLKNGIYILQLRDSNRTVSVEFFIE